MIYFGMRDGYMFPGAIEKDIGVISSRIDILAPSKKHKILSRIANIRCLGLRRKAGTRNIYVQR